MNRLISYIAIVSILTVFTSCADDENSGSSDIPANLVVDIQVSEDNPQVVTITATADHAIRYEFEAGDNNQNTAESNESGQFSYTYESSGVYLIVVRAYGSSGRFVKKEANTVITADNGEVTYPGMTMVWSDEFNGSSLNTSLWTYEIGTGNNGWGNNELQYYRQENTFVDNGELVIEAREESFGGRSYTSSRIITSGKFDFKYGRVDIRAKLPEGQGIWPALWMLGSNFSTVGWPSCGEIDIMEMIGGNNRENTVHGTVHWESSGHAEFGDSYTLPSENFSDDYHVFSILWEENRIIWYVDDIQFNTVDTTPSDLSEFQNSFFFIFNVAVGGNWPGSPDASTVFPQQMKVDYVRVFQNE